MSSEGSISQLNSGSIYYPVGTTVSGFPRSMIENGYQFRNRSTSNRIIWQYLKPLENGRYGEIRYDNHGKEGPHYIIKKMLKPEEKPTKEEFISSIGPELKKSTNKALKKGKER